MKSLSYREIEGGSFKSGKIKLILNLNVEIVFGRIEIESK